MDTITHMVREAVHSPRGHAASNGAVASAYKVAFILERASLMPQKVSISGDGNAWFTFYKRGRFATLECFSNGEVCVCYTNRHTGAEAISKRIRVDEVLDNTKDIENHISMY